MANLKILSQLRLAWLLLELVLEDFLSSCECDLQCVVYELLRENTMLGGCYTLPLPLNNIMKYLYCP